MAFAIMVAETAAAQSAAHFAIFLEVIIMIQNMISQYVRTLFDESQDGWLTIGIDQERFDYEVEWDENRAEELAVRCQRLVDLLTMLAPMQDSLQQSTRRLSKEQLEVWNTYLRPFPEHDMDNEALRSVWEKEAIGLVLKPEERKLSQQYDNWYEKQALQRLPWEQCSPTGLISRARRYVRLVRLQAPAAVQAYEARCLAEEFVLYHCMKQ
jgi:hypothetical protein